MGDYPTNCEGSYHPRALGCRFLLICQIQETDELQLNLRREALRAEYLKHYNSQNVDVVLSPVGPGPAPPLGTSKYWG
jgi:hypothetical protein